MLKRFAGMCLAGILLAAFVAGTTGCNTVRGLGTDIEKGGKAIEDAATRK